MFGNRKIEQAQQGGIPHSAIVDPLKAEVMAHAEVENRDAAIMYRDSARALNDAILQGETSITAVRDNYRDKVTEDPKRQQQVVEHLGMFLGHEIEEIADRDTETAEANITAASNVAASKGAYYDESQARAERAQIRAERIAQIK